MTTLRRLVDLAWDLAPVDVPATARHAASRHLLDGLGCAVAAVRREELTSLAAITALATAPEQAWVIGTGERRPSHVAAFANGALVHALDFDDTHAAALVHPTAVVLPVVLAVGQEVGADGATMLHAAVLGYEVMTRLGAAVPHGFHARGLHATSVVGPLAAALVACWLRVLDRETAVDAVGIAASTSSGLLEFLATGSSTKQLHPGWAAQAGIVAAALAAGGAGGPDSALEGEHGLYRALADRRVEAEQVVAGFGRVWQVERITVKPHPVCQLSHAAIDAALTLRDGLDLGAVDAIEVDVPRDAIDIVAAPLAAKHRPRTAYEAKFSLPWGVATALVDGRVALEAADPPLRDRPEVLALAQRVTVVAVDPDGPAASAPGRVRITLSDGNVREGRVPASRGGPDRPLTDDELVAKFVANAGGGEAAEALARRVLALADEPHADHLLAATTSCA